MRVVILGASGGTGRVLVRDALSRGHEVTAVARSLGALDGGHARLTLRPTDVRDADSLRDAVAGHDAAISVVGGRVRSSGEIYSTGTRSIVAALEHENVRRFICVSSGGVEPLDPGLPLWFRLAIPVFMRELYADMKSMEDVVRASGLDWTIVRSAYLTDKPAAGRFRVEDGKNPRGGWKIARSDLAQFLLDQLDDDHWLKAIPAVAY